MCDCFDRFFERCATGSCWEKLFSITISFDCAVYSPNVNVPINKTLSSVFDTHKKLV